MDTTKEFTAIEWCAGYGGIHLGLKRAIPSLRVIAYGEIEAFACANLVAKMEAGLLDPAPLWTDIKTFPCEEFRDRVGLLVAGYPCQPFSAAGKRLGAEDPRHLWPHIARAIRVIRPRLCFFENVEGHISLGLREVLGDLGAAGYTAAWGIFSASEVGAPHQRKRVFILAVSNSLGGAAGLSRSLAWNEGIAGVAVHGGGEGGGELADPNGRRFQQCESKPKQADNAGLTSKQAWPSQLADAGRIEPQGWCGAADGQQSGAGGIPRGEPAPRHDQVWPSPNELVNAKHLGHDAPEINGGYPAGADSRWTQKPKVHGQPARGCRDVWPSRPGEPQHAWEPPRVVANGNGRGQRECCEQDSSEISLNQQTPQRNNSGGCNEAMGNAEQFLFSATREHGAMDEASGIPADREGRESAQADPESSAARKREGGWANASECGEIKSSMGDPVDGTKFGVGLSELSGLSDQELAEIRHWMVASDNRTDELRLLGNGVVPATAERAFLTLMQELLKGTN